MVIFGGTLYVGDYKKKMNGENTFEVGTEEENKINWENTFKFGAEEEIYDLDADDVGLNSRDDLAKCSPSGGLFFSGGYIAPAPCIPLSYMEKHRVLQKDERGLLRKLIHKHNKNGYVSATNLSNNAPITLVEISSIKAQKKKIEKMARPT